MIFLDWVPWSMQILLCNTERRMMLSSQRLLQCIGLPIEMHISLVQYRLFPVAAQHTAFLNGLQLSRLNSIWNAMSIKLGKQPQTYSYFSKGDMNACTVGWAYEYAQLKRLLVCLTKHIASTWKHTVRDFFVWYSNIFLCEVLNKLQPLPYWI